MTDRAWATTGIGDAARAALESELSASELWSLLLHVIELRAAQRTPTNVRQQWGSDRFVQPAYLDQRTLMEMDRELLAAAAAFEALELSPLAPLGTCSTVAFASQNKIVATVRGTEVVSDPTNVLALESARRLRENAEQTVRLATSHRCVRAQEVPNRPGFAAHFRIFCLSTAGRERKNHAFLIEALIEHLRAHLAALNALERRGYAFPGLAVKILSTPERESLAQRIADALPEVSIAHEALTHRYYDGLRFMISARSVSNEEIPLIDGGAFDWLRKLAANEKLVYVASAIGSQLVAHSFRPSPRSRYSKA